MAIRLLVSPDSHDDQLRLAGLGLSTELVHTGFRPGLSSAANRTAMALSGAAGTDLYHDSMETFHRILAPKGWFLSYVRRQPRLIHPQGAVGFAVSSATGVASGVFGVEPRIQHKGPSTRLSLAEPKHPAEPLFTLPAEELSKKQALVADSAPLWFLLHERTPEGLKLEMARPRDMTPGGSVNGWADRILIPFLELDGDLSVFDAPNDDDFDFSV